MSWDELNQFAFKENVCKSKSVPTIWCVCEHFSLPCLYFAKYCNRVQQNAFLHLNLFFVVAGLEEILQNKQALDAFLCKLSLTCQTKYCLQMNEDGDITINLLNNVRCNILTQSRAHRRIWNQSYQIIQLILYLISEFMRSQNNAVLKWITFTFFIFVFQCHEQLQVFPSQRRCFPSSDRFNATFALGHICRKLTFKQLDWNL